MMTDITNLKPTYRQEKAHIVKQDGDTTHPLLSLTLFYDFLIDEYTV